MLKHTFIFKLLLFCLSCCFALSLQAQQSTVISVQGTLKDGNGLSVPDGVRSATFKLYTSATGGTAIWEEMATIEVIGGVYSHNLGSVEELVEGNFDETVYLGITFGGTELSPRTQMTYAPYALSVFAAQRIARQGCSGQVGDIKYSILNPTQFAEENGSCWVPMNGGDISGSRLASIMGITNAPDMSGLFVRATEYNEGNDPGRSAMAAATVQDDENKEHNHDMGTAGSHNHTHGDSWLSRIRTTATGGSSFDRSIPRSGESLSVIDYYSNDNYDSKYYTNTVGSYNTSTTGDHSHTLTPSGGPETRPTNMNFFIYIRVD